VDSDFWTVRVRALISALAAAELSESYDKGVLGIRKTLATAISALIEYPARGVFGGLRRDAKALQEAQKRDYDARKAEDVAAAFQDFIQQLVYNDQIWDELFQKTAETDDLSKQSSLVRGAHEYIVLNLASFMHYTLVLSPEGPSLLRMVENLHKLAPYMMIRSTLKIGNVATMISGMTRLMLAKLSVSSVMNWVGLSKGEDEGMNLLQQIINQVLGWDKRELRKRLEKVEKDKDTPSRATKKAIDEWISKDRQEHEETRRQSIAQERSIISTILSLSSTDTDITDAQHSKALEYLLLQLSIRDRTEIVRVLCKSSPDHLTTAIREGVSAYEPIIRQVHEAADLSGTLWDAEQFINDLIKTSKVGDNADPPSVEDFVSLLHTHQGSMHRFLHQVAKNGPEVTKWFQDFCKSSSANFKVDESSDKYSVKTALENAFEDLEAKDRQTIQKELDAYTKYLDALHASSASRIDDVIANKSSTSHGPGAYLARWQELLDSTEITPLQQNGPVRLGQNREVKADTRKDVDGEQPASSIDVKEADKLVTESSPEPPNMKTTISLLLPNFGQILLKKTSNE